MTLLIYILLLALYNLVNPMDTWKVVVSLIIGIVVWFGHLLMKGN